MEEVILEEYLGKDMPRNDVTDRKKGDGDEMEEIVSRYFKKPDFVHRSLSLQIMNSLKLTKRSSDTPIWILNHDTSLTKTQMFIL